MKLITCVQIAIAATFVILLITFFNIQTRRTNLFEKKDDSCLYNFYTDCINVCDPSGEFTDDEIKEKLIAEKIPGYNNKTNTYKIFRIPLECPSFHKKITLDSWNRNDWEFKYSGSMIRYDDDYYSNTEFCLRPEKEGMDDKFSWGIVLCYENEKLKDVLHHFLCFLAITLLIIPLIVYGIFPKLRDFHGKLVMTLLISQIVIYIILPIFEKANEIHYNLFPVLLMIMYAVSHTTVLCFCSMCCDVWLTFKHYQNPTEQRKWFKIFIYILFGSFGVLMFGALMLEIGIEYHMHLMPYLFAITVGIILIMFSTILFFLISSFYYMRKISTTSDTLENTKLETEKSRFWLYAKLFSVILIAWIVVTYTLTFRRSHNDIGITGDLIICYCAAIVSFLLLWAPNVRIYLFANYISFESDDDVEAHD